MELHDEVGGRVRRSSRIRRLRIVVVSSAVVSATSGATFPFWILYMHFNRHISTPLAGIIIGFGSVVPLFGSLLGGFLQDHLGPRTTAMFGTAAEGVAFLGFYVARSPWAFFVAFGIFGLSTIRYAARSSLLTHYLPQDLPSGKFFSYEFMAVNAGYAIGTIFGGIVINLHHPATFMTLLAVSAILNFVGAISLLVISEAPHRVHQHEATGYREAILDPNLRRYLLYAAVLSLVSYASFDAGLPGLIGITLHKSPKLVAIGFATNPILIVLFQRPVYALTARLGARRTLKLTSLTFAIAWSTLFATFWFRSTFSVLVDLGCFATFFAFGEMCLSPVPTPVMVALASSGQRGRYFGLGHFARAFSNVIGPTAAGEAIGRGYAYLWLGALVVVGLANTQIADRFARRSNIDERLKL